MDGRPNIILLIADDHRHDALGAAGHATVRTPALDRLAARGTRFTNAHCQGGMTGAICAPSRACLMTGSDLFNATASTELDAGPRLHAISPASATLPQTFRASGYHTHAIGKWHNDRASFAAGFASGDCLFFGGMSDHWAVPLHDFDPTGAYPADDVAYREEHSSEIFAGATIDFLTNYRGEQPFFCYTAFTAPHDPRTAPSPYDRMYDPEHIELPPNVLSEPAFDTGNGHERDERLLPRPRSRPALRRELADYFGIISHLDAQLGRIMDTVEATGRTEDTIVMYVADHGLALGQHGLLGKQNLYDHSVRIPLLLAGPLNRSSEGALPGPGHTDDRLCTLADLMRTLCALAGVPAPTTADGHDLLAEPSRPVVHGAYRDIQRMATDGKLKLIRFSRSADARGTDREVLFDLETDQWETTDRSTDPAYAGDLTRLRESLATWQHRVGDPLAPVTEAH